MKIIMSTKIYVEKESPKTKIIVGVVLAVVTLLTWIGFHEYQKWSDSKPTVKEKAKSTLDNVKKAWKNRKNKDE